MLMLLDTAGMYFRAFYGVPTSMKAPDGTVVNAVRGTLDAMAALISRRSPTRMVACWDDDWRPEFRVAAIPSYKTHRVADPTTGAEEVPDLLSPQLPILVEVLAAAGITRIGMPGYEADDVIGAYAAQRSNGDPVQVVTGDRDLFQLVDDARRISVVYTAKGMRNLQEVDEAFVASAYGIPGRSYAEFAALRGDKSDGLPGVSGVGDKTAAELINRFGTVEAILVAARSGESGLAAGLVSKILAAEDYLSVAPGVVNVVRDLELPDADDVLTPERWDVEALGALSARWGISASVKRLCDAIAG